MESKTNIKCTVCQRHKANLRPRKSNLITNMQMFLCAECFDGKKEPRFAVIMAARSNAKGAREYVLNHRYVGEMISAKELM